jgi:Na+/proline symporter
MEIAYETYQELHWIDISIIAIYMIGVFFLGSYFGKYVESAGDFFVAGRALPFWAIGMSIVVSDIGATDFIATSGAGYTYGIAAANFDWMGSMPAMVFAAFIFVPYYWRAGVYTIPEFLGKRYNLAVRMIHAGIWGVFLLTMLAVMLYLTAVMIHTILGWNIVVCIWLIVAITGVYTFSGGLSAVVMTDVVQLVVMFVGGFALMFLSLYAVGGWGNMKDHITAQPPEVIVLFEQTDPRVPVPHMAPETVAQTLRDAGIAVAEVREAEGVVETTSYGIVIDLESYVAGEGNPGALTKDAVAAALAPAIPAGISEDVRIREYNNFFDLLLPHNTTTPYPWTGIVFGLGIVMATAYMAGNQAVVQRTLGARSEWDAKGGMLFGGFLKVFIPALVIFPGLAAVIVVPDLANGDMAVPEMIKLILPPGLTGLMFAALFAALMSSVDSTLNSSATIWTSDIYGRFVHLFTGAPITERHGLVIGRLFTAVFIILAGILAPALAGQDTMYNFIQTALAMFQGPVFAILLLGILWRRANQWGALAGLVLGVAFTTILNSAQGVFPSDDPFLFIAWWSFVFSAIVTVVVSLITPADPDEKVRGLVFGQVMHDGQVQRVLQQRVD